MYVAAAAGGRGQGGDTRGLHHRGTDNAVQQVRVTVGSLTGGRLCVCSQVKIAYVNFVNHCYVDTEVEMKEIYTSNHIWKLFEDFTVDMARVPTVYYVVVTSSKQSY